MQQADRRRRERRRSHENPTDPDRRRNAHGGRNPCVPAWLLHYAWELWSSPASSCATTADASSYSTPFASPAPTPRATSPSSSPPPCADLARPSIWSPIFSALRAASARSEERR